MLLLPREIHRLWRWRLEMQLASYGRAEVGHDDLGRAGVGRDMRKDHDHAHDPRLHRYQEYPDGKFAGRFEPGFAEPEQCGACIGVQRGGPRPDDGDGQRSRPFHDLAERSVQALHSRAKHLMTLDYLGNRRHRPGHCYGSGVGRQHIREVEVAAGISLLLNPDAALPPGEGSLPAAFSAEFRRHR